MIIWSGWGILVLVFAGVALFISMALREALGLPYNVGGALLWALTGILAGGACFLLARLIENKPGRVYIDEATNQRIEVRNSAGSLFFIPTRWWAYALPVLGIAFGVSAYMGPKEAPPPRLEDAAIAEAPQETEPSPGLIQPRELTPEEVAAIERVKKTNPQ